MSQEMLGYLQISILCNWNMYLQCNLEKNLFLVVVVVVVVMMMMIVKTNITS